MTSWSFSFEKGIAGQQRGTCQISQHFIIIWFKGEMGQSNHARCIDFLTLLYRV